MKALLLIEGKAIMENKAHDFEMILLGDAGVGKTTLFIHLQTGKPADDDTRLTIGVDIAYKTLNVNGQDVTVSDGCQEFTLCLIMRLISKSLSFLR